MKTADFLLLTDAHVNADNISEFSKNWEEAFRLCREKDIKHILFGGDMFTSRSAQPLSTLMAVWNVLSSAEDLGIEITLINGNHDLSDQEGKCGYLNAFDGLPNVNIVDCSIIEKITYDIALLRYWPEQGSFKEHLDDLLKMLDKPERAILFIHEGIHGALGNLDLEDECPNEWFEPFKKVFVGHYHNRTKIKGTNIEYIGSSRQNNFGEDEEKGYTILYSDGSHEFVKNEINTRYRTIEANYGDDISIEKDGRYKTRLKLNCTSEQSKLVSKDDLIEAGFNKVEIITEKVRQVEIAEDDFDKRFDKDGVIKEYKRFCNIKEIDPEIGLKYLSTIK